MRVRESEEQERSTGRQLGLSEAMGFLTLTCPSF